MKEYFEIVDQKRITEVGDECEHLIELAWITFETRTTCVSRASLKKVHHLTFFNWDYTNFLSKFINNCMRSGEFWVYNILYKNVGFGEFETNLFHWNRTELSYSKILLNNRYLEICFVCQIEISCLNCVTFVQCEWMVDRNRRKINRRQHK